MKKITFIVALLFVSSYTYSQKIDTNYYPTKKSHVSNNDFKIGVENLTYAYADINENPDRQLNYIDYWRVATAYARLGEDKETIYKLLLKSKNSSKESFCIILNYQLEVNGGIRNNMRLYKTLGKRYTDLLSECSGVKLQSTKKLPKKSRQFARLKYSKSKAQWNYFKGNSITKSPTEKEKARWINPCKWVSFPEKLKDSTQTRFRFENN